MGTSREKPWRLVARKGRAVQVIFDHMPGMARLVLMGHTKTRKEYTHLDAEDRMRRLLEINGVKELLDNRNR